MILCHFTIDAWPPSVNTFDRWHWSKQNKVKKLWTALAWIELGLLDGAFPGWPYSGPVRVTITPYPPDYRWYDLDNSIGKAKKFINDATEGKTKVGRKWVIDRDKQVILNDRQIVEYGPIKWGPIVKGGRIEYMMETIDDE